MGVGVGAGVCFLALLVLCPRALAATRWSSGQSAVHASHPRPELRIQDNTSNGEISSLKILLPNLSPHSGNAPAATLLRVDKLAQVASMGATNIQDAKREYSTTAHLGTYCMHCSARADSAQS